MAIDAARAKSLILYASDLSDPAERAAYLDRECGEDTELRGRVEALLRANDASPLPPPRLPIDELHGVESHRPGASVKSAISAPRFGVLVHPIWTPQFSECTASPFKKQNVTIECEGRPCYMTLYYLIVLHPNRKLSRSCAF